MGGLFEIDVLESKYKELEAKTKAPDFWSNVADANKVYDDIKDIKKTLDKYYDVLDMIQVLKELSLSENIDTELKELTSTIENLEISTLLNNEYDKCNCYLEIHPGAGGTESCDWAYMLSRMYERFFDRYNYSYKLIDKQAGDEAGIKSITYYITGSYAYGYLKNEKGVHRLVRISPFDSNKRRHTSFASVNVYPEFKEIKEIEIKDEDLKIDVYHSSGAGGQSVNTSNSAVRITHLPTKTVVAVQNERSQLRNKEIAMEILKNKLYEQKLREQASTLQEMNGDNLNIDFGSQIRSYVLEPYKLVKDNRSGYENSDPMKVLDGDLMPIIESVLKTKKYTN